MLEIREDIAVDMLYAVPIEVKVLEPAQAMEGARDESPQVVVVE